jgi:cation:H+ antiporter
MENKEKVQQDQRNVYVKSAGLIGIGVVLLYVGAILTVDNAVVLAQEFGLSEKIIGLTVIAIGTSLPELITSIVAIRKGHADIGIGNIIGSNIYNILMIMGVGAILGGVMVGTDVYVDYAIMIVFSLSLLIALKTRIIGRAMGVCLTIGYVAYLTVTFFK